MPKTKPDKYTAEFVEKEVTRLLKVSQNKKEMLVMGQLFEDTDYSQQRFSEWEAAFRDNKIISESIKKIKQFFENKINAGGLENKLNPAMVIFNLKNNYGWSDRQEITGKDGDPLFSLTAYLTLTASNARKSTPRRLDDIAK